MLSGWGGGGFQKLTLQAQGNWFPGWFSNKDKKELKTRVIIYAPLLHEAEYAMQKANITVMTSIETIEECS
jgi:hypothetical protein